MNSGNKESPQLLPHEALQVHQLCVSILKAPGTHPAQALDAAGKKWDQTKTWLHEADSGVPASVLQLIHRLSKLY